ncbi:MAG TPA: hypothetical protein LFW21_01900 [Rickettsia endosymbiont of Pyrocoelia pectoralis]|nr:hypothetical protein [Rickettsia endosymbiont of Pyrocoelia pectoralis]
MGHSIIIPDDLNNELITAAKLEDISKSQLVQEAIKNYLRELKEDREDAEIALARKNNKNDKLLTSEEADEFLRKKYGL